MANSKSSKNDGQTNQSTNTEINYEHSKQRFSSWILVLISILIAIWMSRNPQPESKPCVENKIKKPLYTMYSLKSDVNSKYGIMKHVHLILNRLGMEFNNGSQDWDLLWAHDYPFRQMEHQLKSLKPHQHVNHFPGTGYITNKVDFATTPSKYVPIAFKLPQDKDVFLKYASTNPDAMFVTKDNQHRGVVVENVKDINVTQEGKFVQEFISKPYLVDGHKFDIGVYTIITSVNPLRAYIYKGDILFRFCPVKYYPFDRHDLDKYVIGDDYLPLWQVPSLSSTFLGGGHGMRGAWEGYVRGRGGRPERVWEQVEDFLRERLLQSEHHIVSALSRYGPGRFFEMMRFDFVVDENLNLYALEANMSPNLSSAHFPLNTLLYEQVLYSVLSLVGVARYTHAPSFADRDQGSLSMKSSDKNLMVSPFRCSQPECLDSCEGVCAVCSTCLSPRMKQSIAIAYQEHMNRNDCKRVFPPPMQQGANVSQTLPSDLSPANKVIYLWFQGKCDEDVTFCN